MQDGRGTELVLVAFRESVKFLKSIWADQGYRSVVGWAYVKWLWLVKNRNTSSRAFRNPTEALDRRAKLQLALVAKKSNAKNQLEGSRATSVKRTIDHENARNRNHNLGHPANKMSPSMNSDVGALLILGVGGNVSQGILKALAASSLKVRTIGACISAKSTGLYLCDEAVISPLANDEHFVDWLIDVCNQHSVSGILSGVEPVLSVLSSQKQRIESATSAKIVVSGPEQIEMCADKLYVTQWLEKSGLNFPKYADSADDSAVNALLSECGYPLFAKPRDGKGSEGIFRIGTDETLQIATRKENYVIQEYLGDEHSEFTAATFSDRDGNVRGSIVMRRALLEGTTVFSQVVNEPLISSQAEAIAEKLRPLGPCNTQFRMHNGKPVCFEINLRYSGTTPLRANFGFNDTEAGVRHYVLGESIDDLPVVREGVALRYWNEIYIDPQKFSILEKTRELSNPKSAASFSKDLL